MKRTTNNDRDVIIIGAGAAGLAAAKAARRHRLSYALVEASSRIGGRAQTDWLLPGCAIDLGAHYLHSASVNPFVGIARRFGFTLQTHAQKKHCYRDAEPLSEQDRRGYEQYRRQCNEKFTLAVRQNRDVPLTDLIDRESPFAPFYTYYLSLMHSKDPQEVSVFDAVLYNETNEDWLVKEGLGALIARHGSELSVTCDCPVTAIDWGDNYVRVRTAKGDLRATAAIITVSTGALGAPGGIRFSPPLPPAKQAAIEALPMGNYKHLYGELRDNALAEPGGGFDALQFALGEELYFHVRPFGMPYLEACVAGGLADALDDASLAAQHDFFVNACRRTFGADTAKRLGRFVASQWRKNRWVRGGYAAARPGHGRGCRLELGKPLSGMLYFAGEAASPDGYNSVHGAYLSGEQSVQKFIADQGKTLANVTKSREAQQYA